MRILAVDQSYTSCGMVILEGNKVVHCEKYVSPTSEDMFDRAHEVASQIVDAANKHEPDLIAIEGLAFSKQGNRTRDLAGLQYVIVCYLRNEGYDVEVIAPNTAKKTAGFGHNEKADMIGALPKAALKKFQGIGVKKTTGLGDLADAYWIGRSV